MYPNCNPGGDTIIYPINNLSRDTSNISNNGLGNIKTEDPGKDPGVLPSIILVVYKKNNQKYMIWKSNKGSK